MPATLSARMSVTRALQALGLTYGPDFTVSLEPSAEVFLYNGRQVRQRLYDNAQEIVQACWKDGHRFRMLAKWSRPEDELPGNIILTADGAWSTGWEGAGYHPIASFSDYENAEA